MEVAIAAPRYPRPAYTQIMEGKRQDRSATERVMMSARGKRVKRMEAVHKTQRSSESAGSDRSTHLPGKTMTSANKARGKKEEKEKAIHMHTSCKGLSQLAWCLVLLNATFAGGVHSGTE